MNVSNSTPSVLHPYFIKTIRPSRRRYVIYRLLVTLAAYQVAFALLQRFFPDSTSRISAPQAWVIFTIIFAFIYAISLYFMTGHFADDAAIKINNGRIEGPTGVRRERTSFPLEKLDRQKTQNVPWINRILQYRHLWSVDGEKILLLAHSFEAPQLQALYEKLELNQNQ